MNTLRIEFEELQKSKHSGTELLFETSNYKYIEWLKYCGISADGCVRRESDVHFPKLIDEMVWYAKKKHAEIVYKKCIEAKKYKWAMKIAYHYGLQDENKNDDTAMSLKLALMSIRNSR